MTEKKENGVEFQASDPNSKITRRDFVGGTLLGAGAALLSMHAPANARGVGSEKNMSYKSLDESWTGPGGIGDYASANGNTHDVVNAAHSLRDGHWKKYGVIHEVGEVDVVVVGGGFSGLTAAFTVQKTGKHNCLVIENHSMFGGEAKRNDMEVDGYRLYGAQGSNAFVWPVSSADKLGLNHPIWHEVGLPADDDEIKWQHKVEGTNKPLMFGQDNYNPSRPESGHIANVGYFFDDPAKGNANTWIVDPWLNDLRDLPVSSNLKRDLIKVRDFKWEGAVPENWEEWLDSMSYKEYLQKVVGVKHSGVFDYLDPMYGAGGAMGSDVTTAYYGVDHSFPRIGVATLFSKAVPKPKIEIPIEGGTFPGGNTGILRYIVKKMIPEAIQGEHNMSDILFGLVNQDNLDRPGQDVRLRLGATVLDVRHVSTPASSSAVEVLYLKNDKVYRVKARGVVMASGQWMNKHVLRDAPSTLIYSMNQFHHAPCLNVNVGLRNWRFMEKLGITAAKWFEGFGWYADMRAPMIVNGEHPPLHPNKPAMLTFYIPFLDGLSQSGMPLKEQCIVARNRLFSMSYADIENNIRKQLTTMFASHGFNADRDIAGIIANRWGHAFVVPQPGFYFGKNGNPADRDIVRQGYGRVRFGHTELSGTQGWFIAAEEGERAARQLLDII